MLSGKSDAYNVISQPLYHVVSTIFFLYGLFSADAIIFAVWLLLSVLTEELHLILSSFVPLNVCIGNQWVSDIEMF